MTPEEPQTNSPAKPIIVKEHAMAHSLKPSAILLFGLLGIGAFSYGAQPPDVVQSDVNLNTAMGFNALVSNNGGSGNTAAGNYALAGNSSGFGNSAFGNVALSNNTTGTLNSAFGAGALASNNGSQNSAFGNGSLANNTTGQGNTGVGAYSLWYSGTGSFNTASGNQALYINYTGSYNTGTGAFALQANTSGYQNTASGSYALNASTVGNHNTASGFQALYSNTNGNSNTADGDDALYANTTGYHNTASGAKALSSNTTGITNVAFGLEALYSNTTGSNNIAVGTGAGYNLTYGNDNIDIGNDGVASESGKIRIGTPGTQIATYIAGIEGTKITGAAVYVTSSGQLGVLASSERYKTRIAPMGANTDKLQQLRPVSFHLKTDPNGPVQYGLIAEEVAKIYPELVIRDEAGKIQGVRYEELAPMLLSKVQQQAAEIRELNQQQKQFATQAELNGLKQQLQAALAALRSKNELVPQP
jgi:hypothetical protein